MKAQSTLEFMGSLILFVAVVVGVLSIASDEIPAFYDSAEISEKNLEARHMTEYILTSEDSGPELVDGYMEVDKEVLEEEFSNTEEYNYSDLREDLGLEYEYNIEFTWFPVVETHRNFVRTRSPDTVDGEEFYEPLGDDTYSASDNVVHFGDITLEGNNTRFLVTAIDGEYTHVYYSYGEWYSWNGPIIEGEQIPLNDRDLTLEAIQNRDDTPGAALVFSSEFEHADGLNRIGPGEASAEGEVEKINRYPIINDPDGSNEIARMEVLVW